MTRRLLDAEAADDFSRQHLANFIWALATLEHDPGGRTGLIPCWNSGIWAQAGRPG